MASEHSSEHGAHHRYTRLFLRWLAGWLLIVVGLTVFWMRSGYGSHQRITSITQPSATPDVAVATSVAAARVDKTAPIEIVEYGDFQCPYCATVEPTLSRVLHANQGRVRLTFRHFPLDFHRQARPAALAAECAREQGAFWEMHDQI